MSSDQMFDLTGAGVYFFIIISRSEARRATVSLCVYEVIVEKLADGILGVKHGVAAFVIQFLEC